MTGEAGGPLDLLLNPRPLHDWWRGMGLLDQLWDETLAGPRPESGLGKLRKFPSSPASSSSSPAAAAAQPPISRSITILRPPALQRTLTVDTESLPSSPSSAPASPSTPTTPRTDWRRLRKKKPQPEEPRSPTAYDWVVISALDR